MKVSATFWDNISEKYRATPISDAAAYEYTLERVASHLKTTDRVLELGCGTGGSAVKLAPLTGHITATDFSTGMIDQAKARPPVDNVTFRVADVYDVEFPPEGFDAILAFNLFHLVADLEQQIARIHGLLAPGGVFISKTPCLVDPSAALKLRLLVRLLPLMQWVGKAPFAKFYKIAELEHIIQRAGFDIIETGNYPASSANHFVVARKI